MKDSQLSAIAQPNDAKYIKANNERFSTENVGGVDKLISISRRIMKDSQPDAVVPTIRHKYIKENNERFSTKKAQLFSST